MIENKPEIIQYYPGFVAPLKELHHRNREGEKKEKNKPKSVLAVKETNTKRSRKQKCLR